jgi:hypothetical protein
MKLPVTKLKEKQCSTGGAKMYWSHSLQDWPKLWW